MGIEVGKIYNVMHNRKGTFRLLITETSGEWVCGQIVAGTAGAMLDCNVKEVGEMITVRESFCTFREITDHEDE